MKPRLFTALLFILIVAAARAWAEPPPPPPGGPEEFSPADMENNEDYRKKLEERVFRMVVWDLADEMNLPAEQESMFLDLLRDYFKKRTELAREQVAAMWELEEINKDKNKSKDNKIIQQKLKTLEENRERQQKLEDDFQNRLKGILTVKQQAKFAVAWPKAMDRVRKFIDEHREMRKKQMNGKGPKGKFKPGEKGPQPPDQQPGPPPKMKKGDNNN